ncbi:MAG: glycosyltransferase family 2 protein [Acidimicrobiales bacterium]
MSDLQTPLALGVTTDAPIVSPPKPARPEPGCEWIDPRRDTPRWFGPAQWKSVDRKLGVLFPLAILSSLWYFSWLLRPDRVGDPVLYGLLVTAELFNLVQAAGFWWTCRKGRDRGRAPVIEHRKAVDVFIPVYTEPLEVVGPTVAAAAAMRGAELHVYVLDDAGRPELRELAERHGVTYVRRASNAGAKAGNLNHALGVTFSPYFAVFDCDHVPDPAFMEETVGWLEASDVAFVQVPQLYANASQRRLTAAASAQQSLFFGGIARGKDGLGAMICCGTNFVARRSAIDEVGGFPMDSLTEDFSLSIRLRERGWRGVYVNKALAQGLGPEDMASYVSQQQRWSRGCLAAIPEAIRAELPWRDRLQFLLSSMFFLSGWTFALYMALPIVRIFSGHQPLAGATAAQFVFHFAPYFCISLAAVAVAGAGVYTFEAFALMIANFWIHILSALFVLAKRTGRFVVTAKHGSEGAQPLTALPALLVMAVLGSSVGYAFDGRFTPGTLNNVAFACFHLSVLTIGVWPAIAGRHAQVERSPRHPESPSGTEALEDRFDQDGEIAKVTA